MALNSTLHRARVARVDADGAVWVEVFELGQGHVFGPCQRLSNIEFLVDDRVVVAQVGFAAEDIVIVGHVNPTIEQEFNILPGSLTDVEFNALNKDGLAAVPSLRTLGTGAQQAAAGNHNHDAAYAAKVHTHTKSNITDFAHTHPHTEVTGLGTSATKDVASSGNASSTQVVLGNDSRLTDARTPTTHTHTKSQITDFAHSHAIGDLPVATSGTSSSTQLVRADDSRLSNARTPVAHTHNQSDINGLGTALAAKADLVGGKIPTSQIPSVALGNAVPVASQAAMLALTSAQVQPGDVAVRSDGAGTFMLIADDPSVLANWQPLNSPTDVVTSVNGQVGTVSLGAADVGARPSSWVPAWTDVTGKPTTFTPSTHTHTKSQITDFAHTHPNTEITGLGTASTKNTPATGNAASTEVVLGSDTRLTDARTPVAHTHTKANITDFAHSHAIGDLPVATSGTSSATQLVRADDSRLSNARTPTAHTHVKANITDFAHTHSNTEITGLGTASTKDVAATGDASTTQVVMGNDTRLSDARTPVAHTHTKSQITDFDHSHAIGDLPVAASGSVSATQLVRADDSRLSNARVPTAHTHPATEVTEDTGHLFVPGVGSNGQVLKSNGTSLVWGTDNNTTYSAMSQAEAEAGTATTGRVIDAARLKASVLYHAPVKDNDPRLSDARTPTAHTHTKSQITDFAHTHAIGDLPVATSGTSSATQLVRADDSRLSNARTPVAHTHGVADISATGTRDATTALFGDGTWKTPAVGSHTHDDRYYTEAETDLRIAEAKSTNHGYRYTYDLTIYGDHDKYYPVAIFGGDQNVKRDLLVKRSYSELHPPEWNSATHGGGLTLKIKWNFGGWGGASYGWELHELQEQYNPTFAGATAGYPAGMGGLVFLRGGGTGGAIYHFFSDQPLEGSHDLDAFPIVYYNSDVVDYDSAPQYTWTMPAPRTTPDLNDIDGHRLQIGFITHDDVASANKDGLAAVPSLRTLGTGAQQAVAGNDTRLSDARTPVAHTHTKSQITDFAHTHPTSEVTGLFDSTAPAALGTVAAGSATIAARRDHVHAMPTAAQVGAAAAVHTHDDRYFTETEADARFINVIEAPSDGVKRVRRLTGINLNGGNLTGALVIETNLTSGNHMCNIHVHGYNYDANEQDVDLYITFYYTGTQSVTRYEVVNKGAKDITNVVFAKNASNELVLIINAASVGGYTWQYPKLTVEGIFGHTIPSDAAVSGWTLTHQTVLTAYTTILTATAVNLTLPKAGTATTFLRGDRTWQTTSDMNATATASSRASDGLTGGGTITCDASYNLKWTTRFIAMANGKGTHWASAGYFDINMPAAGVVIPGYAGATNKTVVAAGIPLTTWDALYFIPTLNGTGGSYAVVGYTGAAFVVPEHWILIAIRGESGQVRLGNGMTMYANQSITVSNPYPQYSLTNHTHTVTVPDNATLGGSPTIGGGNTAVIRERGVKLSTDTINTVESYTDGKLTQVLERDGTTTIKTTTINYSGDDISSIVEVAGGTTVTTTFGYTGGVLTSTSKTVA